MKFKKAYMFSFNQFARKSPFSIPLSFKIPTLFLNYISMASIKQTNFYILRLVKLFIKNKYPRNRQ
jgi:hypothetical protein